MFSTNCRDGYVHDCHYKVELTETVILKDKLAPNSTGHEENRERKKTLVLVRSSAVILRYRTPPNCVVPENGVERDFGATLVVLPLSI